MGPRGAGLKAGQLAITGIINTGEPPTSLGKDVWDQRESTTWMWMAGGSQIMWPGHLWGARRCPSWFLSSTWGQCETSWGLLTHTCREDNHLLLHNCMFAPKSAKFHSVRQMKMKDEFINNKMHLCSSYLSSAGAAVYGQYFIWCFQVFLSALVHCEARWCMKQASTTPEHDWTLQRRDFI